MEGELNIGDMYYTKAGDGRIIPFCPTGRCKGNENIWYDGGLSRNIKDIEPSLEKATFINYAK